nr:FAD-dependent oxidoreductase [Rhizobium leguminosarum]
MLSPLGRYSIAGRIPAGGSAPLPAFAFQAETTALDASRTAAGFPMSRRQKYHFDKLVKIVKDTGANMSDWLTLHVASTAPSELQSRVNQIRPGTNDLTLTGAGTPTWTANDRWSGWSSTTKYNTGIGLQTFAQGQFTMFYYSRTTTGGSSGDFGAQTASGDGIGCNVRDVNGKMNARLQATNFVASGTFYPGQGMHSITSDSIDTFGISREAPSPTYVAPSTNPTIHLGGINGGAVSIHDCGLFAIFKVKLTAAQRMRISAALLDYYEKGRFGFVDVYEAGFAPQYLSYDAVVYGGSWTAVCAAYAAKQAGLNVCLVTDRLVKTDWGIAGMPTQGLAYMDCYAFTACKGLWRDLTSWANGAIYNRADTNNQACNSLESRVFLQGVRRMLDPARSAGTLILGQDIPVYFSTGIKEIRSTGLVDSVLVTNDGREFTGQVFIGADYDGEYVFKSGLPYIIGSEAQGTGSEAGNGYQGSGQILKPYSTYDIDPYVVAGNPASGLLPDIQGTLPLPGLTIGGVDPSLESMNYRLAMTTDLARKVNISVIDPVRNDNPLRFETCARLYVQKTDCTVSNPANTQTILQFTVGPSAPFVDVNNGSGGLSTDLGGSGYNYAHAADDAARQAVVDDLRDYSLNWWRWHNSSGDARIPSALVTQFNNLQLDAAAFLDAGPGELLFWPSRPYQRDPIWQLKNAGYVSSGSDYAKTDGFAPRSLKTVAVTSYDSDRHRPWKVVSGGLLYNQGGVPEIVAGTDKMAPIPLEAIVPDVSVKTNVIIPWASSSTKIAWFMERLELTGGLKGEAAGVIAAAAIAAGVPVQNVDYDNVIRPALLARDVNHPYLPQVA